MKTAFYITWGIRCVIFCHDGGCHDLWLTTHKQQKEKKLVLVLYIGWTANVTFMLNTTNANLSRGIWSFHRIYLLHILLFLKLGMRLGKVTSLKIKSLAILAGLLERLDQHVFNVNSQESTLTLWLLGVCMANILPLFVISFEYSSS